MLAQLSIRNIVIIDALDLTFEAGLCVLSGETGAGKSILLDALGLVLGARGSLDLIRAEQEQASVTAVFDLPPTHKIWELLQDQDIPFDTQDGLILKRVLKPQGKTKAFINNTPVTVQFLNLVGGLLLSIHGQFDQLLDQDSHLLLVDSLLEKNSVQEDVKKAFGRWKLSAKKLSALEEKRAHHAEREVFLKQAIEDLTFLDPQKNEEAMLLEKRTFAMEKSRIGEAYCFLQEKIGGEEGAESLLHKAYRCFEKVEALLGDKGRLVLEALDQASQNCAEVLSLVSSGISEVEMSASSTETLDERLSEIRTVARRYGGNPDSLDELLESLKEELASLSTVGTDIKALELETSYAKKDYEDKAQILSEARQKQGQHLENKVAGLLPALKLDRARLVVSFDKKPEQHWSEKGWDQALFLVQTNPGTPLGPFSKIASGGERSRFMLALKTASCEYNVVPTVIFDEIDSGVGGAVAAAIGSHLRSISKRQQVLVITHSPQVAASGDYHWRIEKIQKENATFTRVTPLTVNDRVNEVARMVSGTSVTDEAKIVATQLLEAATPCAKRV